MADDVWKTALKRAALPGAARVVFEKCMDPQENAVSYSLKSYTVAGQAIGDDRDYDLLKAVITPLERLSEGYGGGVEVSLNIESDELSVEVGS